MSRSSAAQRQIAAAPVASSSPMSSSEKQRERTVPSASSTQAQRQASTSPSGGPVASSTASASSSSINFQSGPHSGRPATKVRPPSTRTSTSPAGGRRIETGARSLPSSQAVPTLGWPAKSSSSPGV